MDSSRHRLRRRFAAAALVTSMAATLMALGTATPAFAAAGDIDTTFNSPRGIRAFDVHNVGGLPGCQDCVDKARGVAIQPDGKIVIAGELGGDGAGYYVARLNVDGTPDTSFGNIGDPFRPAVPGFTKVGGAEATSVALDPQGRVYAAGFRGNAFFVARFTAQGLPDTSFGGQGTLLNERVINDLGGFAGADEAQAVAIDSEGRVVVAGYVDAEIVGREPPSNTGGPNNLVGLVRLTSTGAFDTSFDTDGRAVVNPTGTAGDFTDGGNGFKARALAIDSQNRPIVAGYHESQYTCTHPPAAPACGSEFSVRDGVGVYRFGVNGGAPERYESFGPSATLSEALAVIVHKSTGRILVAGSTNASNFSVLGLNASLQLDSGFGDAGVKTVSITGGADTAVALAEDALGRIVVAGNANYTGIAWDGYGIARLAANGQGSADFTTSVAYGAASGDAGVFLQQTHGVAVAPDGRIVVVGRNELVTGNPDNQNSVILAIKPEVPTAGLTIAGSPGNASAQVTFTPPAGNPSGASKLTYTATANPGGATCSTTSPQTQCTITGLTNNTTYVVTAVYTTAGGNSPTSNAVNVTPSPVPGAPGNVTTSIANDATTVTWTAASDSGSPITSYTATASPGGSSCTTSTLTCTITNLVNGTQYAISVRATNAAGTGPASTAVNVTPGMSRYVPLASPTRFLDTRNGIGRPGTAKPVAGAVIELQVTGVAGVPADALAVVMNVTATETGGAGYLSAYPAGGIVPNASSVNIDSQDQTIANLVTAKIGAGGKVSLYTFAPSHILADVAGYYVPAAAASAGRFVGFAPQRLIDTRDLAQPVAARGTLSLAVAGRFGVPQTGTSAVVLNLTAVDPAGPGYVTAFPSGQAVPTASNINLDYFGQIIANQVIVPVGADGRVVFFAYDSVDLVVDVAGYYTDASAVSATTGIFVPTNPNRVFDTRPTRATAGSTRTVAVAGRSGLPASGMGGVVVNLTALNPGALGFVTAFPSGNPPTASNLNLDYPGQIISNHVTVALSGGAFTLYTFEAANLIVDVNGFFLS